ncbi:50S ribosomal protein L23 [Salibacter halophilus]|mgnify:FL=1|jgi:large subunit ribosomal protein L23|uniref:Large ribosomal subunit protein uL23 n=1 Tax=Salibacter halophilus TaxID=1803916 RepID=A0A6N6MAN3_9FLAO|nr:50S ribosomal protein L23 [Salibacter halophilus]KAB1066241.1 50S ribosomal protein L23 [Salibacter halophilus]
MSILLKPIITEKMTNESELRNKYAFKVQREANKIEIKDAVEDAYGVTVESVNTMVHPGKRKTRYTKTGIIDGNTGTYKKAVVTVKDGDVIDFYSNI